MQSDKVDTLKHINSLFLCLQAWPGAIHFSGCLYMLHHLFQERLEGITSYLAQTSLEFKNDPIQIRWSKVAVTLRNTFFGHDSRIHTLIMTKMSHTSLTRYSDEVMMF